MKIVSFIGYRDKTELIMYISKIVNLTNDSKVLIIDSYTSQKCRTIIPAIVNDDEYITTFEGIDIAVGFKNYKTLLDYCEEYTVDFEAYDYVFIDINSIEMSKGFDSKKGNFSFVISTYDKYELLKTIVILHELANSKTSKLITKLTLNKIYWYSVLNTSDEQYINHNFNETNMDFDSKIIYLPLDEGDTSILIQNQYSEKMLFRQLSKTFKKALVEITTKIMEDVRESEIQRAFKNIERGG